MGPGHYSEGQDSTKQREISGPVCKSMWDSLSDTVVKNRTKRQGKSSLVDMGQRGRSGALFHSLTFGTKNTATQINLGLYIHSLQFYVAPIWDTKILPWHNKRSKGTEFALRWAALKSIFRLIPSTVEVITKLTQNKTHLKTNCRFVLPLESRGKASQPFQFVSPLRPYFLYVFPCSTSWPPNLIV